MFISKKHVEKYGEKTKKKQLLNSPLEQKNVLSISELMSIHLGNSSWFLAAKLTFKENMHLNIFFPDKNYTGRSN